MLTVPARSWPIAVLLAAAAIVMLLLLPALAAAQDPAPAAPVAPAPSPIADQLADLLAWGLALAAAALVAAVRGWLRARFQRDQLIGAIEVADKDGVVKAATARLGNAALDKRVADITDAGKV